jgi:hypothetical protein
MTQLAATWKDAKTTFERTTGKKKPSESVFTFFRSGTGIGDVLKKADAAWSDPKKLAKLATEFKKKADDYKKTLKKTMEADDKGNAAIKGLVVTLDLIGSQLDTREQELASGDGSEKELEDAIKRIVAEKTKNLAAVLGDRKWREAFRAHLKKEYSDYHLDFLEQCAAKADKAGIFDRYVKDGAEEQVNVSGALLKAAWKQAEGGDWDKVKLKPIADAVTAMLQMDSLPRFAASKPARELAAGALKKVRKLG